MYEHLKKLLFKLEPEMAHNLAEVALRAFNYIPFLQSSIKKKLFVDDALLNQELFGKRFLNPVGLAAGFDKNGTMIEALNILGFGFVEIGTITPLPQEGNPKPRLFRHIDKNSLQNQMGFNNDGSEVVLGRIKDSYPFSIPLGINIGKNKITPQDKAIEDYKRLVQTFNGYCDYFVINISSPNTPNLRNLQNESFVTELFLSLKNLTKTPIFLKISPDMDINFAIMLCNKAVECGANGIIATNTTTDYLLISGIKETGGLSGDALREKSYLFFKAIAKELFKKCILISVGGIADANEAYKRIKAGANLIQVYTAFVYKGWNLAKDINLGLIELLKKDGFNSITEAVGIEVK